MSHELTDRFKLSALSCLRFIGLIEILFDTATSVFEKIVREALSESFEEVLKYAIELRENSRINSNFILVIAALHPNRQLFNKNHPGYFRECGMHVIRRPDDIFLQFSCFQNRKEPKSKLPACLKRLWANRLSTFPKYELKKYLKKGRLIDMVRICHASSPNISEMIKTGTLKLSEKEEAYSDNKGRVSHKDLLRNLPKIYEEKFDITRFNDISIHLKNSVSENKYSPFKYYYIWKSMSYTSFGEALEECMNMSLKNLPKFKGKTICLTDNSGSAQGTFISKGKYITASEIANFSSVVTCMNSDEGYIGIFGDKLDIIKVNKQNTIVEELAEINVSSRRVGERTETGIWMFFEDAINNNKYYDNIFIYSDMQACMGELYGHILSPEQYVCGTHFSMPYYDVQAMIDDYRKYINPQVNIFSIKLIGNDIPTLSYRGALLYGWTGKELMCSKNIIDRWDEIENKD